MTASYHRPARAVWAAGQNFAVSGDGYGGEGAIAPEDEADRRGDAGEPQDEVLASYYGPIEDEAAWKAIDWTQPARTVHNVVRSSGVWPR